RRIEWVLQAIRRRPAMPSAATTLAVQTGGAQGPLGYNGDTENLFAFRADTRRMRCPTRSSRHAPDVPLSLVHGAVDGDLLGITWVRAGSDDLHGALVLSRPVNEIGAAHRLEVQPCRSRQVGKDHQRPLAKVVAGFLDKFNLAVAGQLGQLGLQAGQDL